MADFEGFGIETLQENGFIHRNPEIAVFINSHFGKGVAG